MVLSSQVANLLAQLIPLGKLFGTLKQKNWTMSSWKGRYMQPYQHISAKGNQGAVTLAASLPDQKLVVLGASCAVSVSTEDGPVLSFTVVPRRRNEVVAIAIVKDGGKVMEESFLLHVTLDENGKANVDLKMPFASAPEAVGQLLERKGGCLLQVRFKDAEEPMRLSVYWSPISIPEGVVAGVDTFRELCVVLAEACGPAPVWTRSVNRL